MHTNTPQSVEFSSGCSNRFNLSTESDPWRWNSAGRVLASESNKAFHRQLIVVPRYFVGKIPERDIIAHITESRIVERNNRRRHSQRVTTSCVWTHDDSGIPLRQILRGGVNRWVYFSYRPRFYRLIFPIILSFSVSPNYYEGHGWIRNLQCQPSFYGIKSYFKFAICSTPRSIWTKVRDDFGILR